MRRTTVTIGPDGTILHEGPLAGGLHAATGATLPVLADPSLATVATDTNPAASKSAVGALRACGLYKVALEEIFALRRPGTKLAATDAERRERSLAEAYRRIAPLFLKMRWYMKPKGEKKQRWIVGTESPTYLSPKDLARSWLGGNYKLDKRPDTGAKAKILVEGLSLLPHSLILQSSKTTVFADEAKTIEVLLFEEYLKDIAALAKKLPQNFTLCLGSSDDCRAACLTYSGHNWAIQHNAKIKMAKTIALLTEPVAFLRFLYEALDGFAKEKADDHYVRLNVLQDIPWESFSPWVFTEFAGRGVSFYDYTKVASRESDTTYDLTFSFSGVNEALCKRELAAGRRVAVVFLGMRYKETKTQIKKGLPPGEWLPFKTSKEEAAQPTPGELLDNPKDRCKSYRCRLPRGHKGPHVQRKKHDQSKKAKGIPCDEYRCVLKKGHAGEHKKKMPLPATFWGYPVVDGDESDLRPLDRPTPCIVALRFKTPFGQEIDPAKDGFAFATQAYVVDDVVRGLSRNPGEAPQEEHVEYMIAGTSERATGFKYDREVGPDEDGAAEIAAKVRSGGGVAWIDRAGQLGA